MKEKRKYGILKMCPFTIVFFAVLMFCALTLLPIQDILLYSNAFEQRSLAKGFVTVLFLNIILILINSNRKMNNKISMILSFIFGAAYLIIIINFKMGYYLDIYSILRLLMAILSLKYVVSSISIKQIIRTPLYELKSIEEYSIYRVPDIQRSKHITNNFYYWVDRKNKAANMELISASILILYILFGRDDYFTWVLFVLIILNIIKVDYNKCVFIQDDKE